MQQRLAPDSLINSVPALQMGFSWAMSFCQDVTDQCTLSGSADSRLSICREHSTPLLLGSEHGMGSRGFRRSYADNFWVLARGGTCTDVHDISRASGCADVLGYEVSPTNSYCSGTGKRIARIRTVAQKVSSRRRICGRATELVNGHGTFGRSAIVVLSQSLTPT